MPFLFFSVREVRVRLPEEDILYLNLGRMCQMGRIAIWVWVVLCPSLALGVQKAAVSHQHSAVSSQKTDSRKLAAESLRARCAAVGETPDERVAPRPEIAPGAPPLLSFRYYQGAAHHRYNHSDLMLDDAGH